MADISRLLQMSAGVVTGVDLTTSELKLNQIAIKDVGGSFYCYFDLNETLGANRTLSIKVNDAARTLDLQGNTALNQALLTTSSPTFNNVTISSMGANATDAATRGYVDLAVQGLDWQDSVKDMSLAVPPGVPVSGDRYIVGVHSYAIVAVNAGTETFSILGDHAAELVATNKIVVSGSTGNDGTWTVVSATFNTPNTDIVVSEDVTSAVADGTIKFAEGAWNNHSYAVTEYSGAAWTFEAPNEGFATWVEDEDALYVYNGTAWVKFGSTLTHNNLSGLDGGTTGQYYHLTSTTYGYINQNVTTTASPTFVGLTLSSDITTTGAAIDWDLKDNDASALSFDAAGKAGILNIKTTDGSEGITLSGTITMATGASIDEFSTDGTMAGNSNTALPTEAAVVTYVASQIGAVSPDILDKTVTLGESMGVAAETHIYPVRYALNGETAGRFYKANKDAVGNCYAIGFVSITGEKVAGNTATLIFAGVSPLGADDTAFGGTDIGKPVYITGAGTYGVTAPTTAGEAVYRLGIVATTTSVEVLPQLNGVN